MHARRNDRNRRRATLVTLVAAALGATAHGQWHEEATILEAVGEGTYFGYAVAMDGNVAVVGATQDDTMGNAAGAAYVCRFNGSSWVSETKLVAADGRAGDQFGSAVAIEGNLIIVGAPHREEVYRSAGAAYVFRYDEEAHAWQEEAYLVRPDGDYDYFGQSVGISGDWAIVGSPNWDSEDVSDGAVHIWRHSGTHWSHHTTEGGAGDANGQLGTSVAIRGDVLLAGAPGADGLGHNRGRVLVGHHVSGEWIYFWAYPPDPVDNAEYGISVAFDGSHALVGASGYWIGGAKTGAAFLYRLDELEWHWEGMLFPSDGGHRDEFGLSVAISGALALVGAPRRDGDDGADVGAVYVYRSSDSGWKEESRILASDGRRSEQYGRTVAVGGNTGLIGRLKYADYDGALYVYRCAYVLGTRAQERAGHAVASAGDVDRDGFDDIVVGAPYDDDQDGRVDVFSGRTRLLLFSRRGSKGERLGFSVAGAGDLDRDGRDDIVAGAPYHQKKRGRVRVLSGRDGRPLETIAGEAKGDRFGHAVAGGVDVDDDNRPDIVVGAPYNDDSGGNAGKVYVYSGRNGREIDHLTGRHKGDRFGWSLAALENVDGDDHGDVAVGAPRNDDRGKNAGKVYVYSGRRLELLYTLKGKQANARFGSALAAAGRADGDGRTDLVVGSPYYDRSWGANAGRADVHSGRDGDRLWSKTGSAAGDRLGWQVAGVGDVDGDGRDDVAIGVPRHDAGGSNAGRADIRSGRNGSLLARAEGERAGDQCGLAVAGLGDVNADGLAEVLVGAPLSDAAAPNAGKVHVLISSTGGAMAAADYGGDAGVEDDAPRAPGPWSPDVDLGDGDVPDLVTLLAQWGSCAAGEGDVDADGDVDVDDLLIFLEDWEP